MRNLDEAFHVIKRAGFLPPEVLEMAGADIALPIGYNQTNSQPSTVRLMLEWLAPEPNQTVLDVGSGSGWTSALLGYLVMPYGQVYAVERIPELLAFGAENCKLAGILNVKFIEPNSNLLGLPEKSPYDRILVSASAKELPQAILNQLKVGGRAVLPVRDRVIVVERIGENNFRSQEHAGFAFVPLI